MAAPAEEHLIKILKTAVEVMCSRNVADSMLTAFVLRELISGLNKDSGTNMTSRASSLIQMVIDDLEAIQFEIEAEHGPFVSKEEDWGRMGIEALISEASK